MFCINIVYTCGFSLVQLKNRIPYLGFAKGLAKTIVIFF